jgi:murein DD-endopeptidase MepM/ murein hydrolase activator NlpD
MPQRIRAALVTALITRPSLTRTRWLQCMACAVMALAWFRGASLLIPERLTDEALARAGAATEAHRGSIASEAGIGLATLEIIVGRNDTLDRIFRRAELSLADLASMRSLPSMRGQLDRLYPGETLKLLRRGAEFVGLERQISDSETLHVTRDEAGFAARVTERPLERRLRTARAVIDSSLFEAAAAASIRDATALAIADIFRYDIDFVLDIHPGDEFTVSYEQLWRDGAYVKDGAVLAVRFTSGGREYRAVRFTGPDGVAGYFTPDGRSLRRSFLRAPLEFTRVSSGFNSARYHPILNLIRAHQGVDYAAPIGTPVRAAGEGRVLFVGVRGGYGNLVELAHPGGVTTVYGHLSRFASGLRAGQHVAQGSLIAYVGMTGLATGPHLHYEYRVNGVYKNPQTVKLPDAAPIAPELRAAFLRDTGPLLAALEPISHQAVAAR